MVYNSSNGDVIAEVLAFLTLSNSATLSIERSFLKWEILPAISPQERGVSQKLSIKKRDPLARSFVLKSIGDS